MKLAITVVTVLALAGVAAAQPAPPEPAKADACFATMKADPAFAGQMVIEIGHHLSASDAKKWCGDQTNDDVIKKAHEDADYHIEKNERHVVLAYAAMWLIAAGFVVFLWRRQQALKLEIAQLRKDLDAAAKENS
jgi:hypothetical protein